MSRALYAPLLNLGRESAVLQLQLCQVPQLPDSLRVIYPSACAMVVQFPKGHKEAAPMNRGCGMSGTV